MSVSVKKNELTDVGPDLPAVGAKSGGDGSLTIDGVRVRRGSSLVVRDVTLEGTPGEITALLGPNGAGKSSLVLAVGGVLRAEAGSMRLGDVDYLGRRPEQVRAGGIAIVPEGRRLLPSLTVEDNLRVAGYPLARRDRAAARSDALDLFPELRKRLGVYAGSLSGGEQQMVVLAQALLSKPRFLVIDELSLGLAPVVVKRLLPSVKAIAEAGAGVLLIEQFATIALWVATRAYVMEGSRIRYHGTAAELRERPELLHAAYLLRGADEDARERNDNQQTERRTT